MRYHVHEFCYNGRMFVHFCLEIVRDTDKVCSEIENKDLQTRLSIKMVNQYIFYETL